MNDNNLQHQTNEFYVLSNMEKNLIEISSKLENVKKDIERFYVLTEKLDVTNHRLQELISDVQKIIAIHEQRLNNQDEYSDEINKRIDHIFNNKIPLIEDRLNKLEKTKWILFGAFSVLTVLLKFFNF